MKNWSTALSFECLKSLSFEKDSFSKQYKIKWQFLFFEYFWKNIFNIQEIMLTINSIFFYLFIFLTICNCRNFFYIFYLYILWRWHWYQYFYSTFVLFPQFVFLVYIYSIKFMHLRNNINIWFLIQFLYILYMISH